MSFEIVHQHRKVELWEETPHGPVFHGDFRTRADAEDEISAIRRRKWVEARRRRHARRNPRRNPPLNWPLILGVAAGVVVVGGIAYANTAAKPALPVTPTTPPGPQNYQFSTNNTGGSVTLHPGDTVSFSFPNTLAAASTAGNDWFWTVAPNLVYQGRTIQTTATGLIETDTFTWGGGAAATSSVVAQFQASKAPAVAVTGGTVPTAYPVTGSSQFTFTINTLSS